LLWAYFEALRLNRIEPGVPGEIPIWDRADVQPLPSRPAHYPAAVAHEFLWPYFLRQMEDLDLAILAVAREKFIEADLDCLKRRSARMYRMP